VVAPAQKQRAREVGRITTVVLRGAPFPGPLSACFERVVPTGTGFTPARPGALSSPLPGKAWLLAAGSYPLSFLGDI